MNTPAYWARQALEKAPHKKSELLVELALEMFAFHTQVEIIVPKFLHLERLFCIMRPECTDEATYVESGVEYTECYLDCPSCQESVSEITHEWFTRWFLPNHPEWREPEKPALLAAIEAMKVELEAERIRVKEEAEFRKNPQLKLFAF